MLSAVLFAEVAAGDGGVKYLASTDWQPRRLFHPTLAKLKQDAAGRMFIYDGLNDKDVERAMDEPYDCRNSLMSLRIKVTGPARETVAYTSDR